MKSKWWNGLLVASTLAVGIGLTSTLSAQTASPSQKHWDFPEIPAVVTKMKGMVDAQEIAGGVTLVLTPTRILHFHAVGESDKATHRPMETDSLFWVASMTKPLTGLAICKLEEEGKLKLEDPVSKYLPEFKELKDSSGNPVEVTILHLLTHTSGMAEPKNEAIAGAKTLADLIPIYGAGPVAFPPGSKWKYCQSSINTAGRIVEVVSGKAFEQYLQQEFFEPLNMKDSTFYPSEKQLARLATPYQRTEAGTLEPTPEAKRHPLMKDPSKKDRFPAANGGLFSTALDYGRFSQMLLNEGEIKGKRIVKPETVKRFRTLHTGPEITTGFTPGNGWGVGTCVVREPQGITRMLSTGTFGHGGAYGTQFWIDPEKKVAVVLMIQRSNFPNGDASPVREAFQEAAFSNLKKKD